MNKTMSHYTSEKDFWKDRAEVLKKENEILRRELENSNKAINDRDMIILEVRK